MHFLLVTVVPGCLLAGWWQVHRALSGNLLSYFYSVEWPVFAVLGVVAWWQLVHDRPAGEELSTPGDEDADSGAAVPGARAQGRPASTGPSRRRRSWLYHQDDFEGPRVAWDPAQESAELAAYNRYLRALAAGKARKTWGNPRGLPGLAGHQDAEAGLGAPVGSGAAEGAPTSNGAARAAMWGAQAQAGEATS